MGEKRTKPATIRLALRQEGSMWNAYVAKSNTMEGSILIGSIILSAVIDNPKRKQAFQQMMTDAFADFLEAEFGQRPEMKTQPAPEHEKAGNA